MDNFKKATIKYVEADKKYKDYVSQFISVGWAGEKFDMPRKALTKNDIEKIKQLKKKLDEAYKEWFNIISPGIKN